MQDNDKYMYECILIVSGLLASEEIEDLTYILDKKFGVVEFIHEMLQLHESGKICENAIIACGNIAAERQFRDLVFTTNFLFRIKSIIESENLSKRVVKDIFWAMIRCTSKPLPSNVIDIFSSILSELIHSKDEEILK